MPLLATEPPVRAPVQRAALLVGAVLSVLGVLGFVPGVTTGYGAMEFASHESGAELLGVFQVSVLHNLLHLAYGLAGVALARTPSAAYTYLLVGGAGYLVLWSYGLSVGQDSDANFVPVDAADDWLHLVLGVTMIGLALVLGRSSTRTGAR
ncbi:DUF4383 domain-containing protein [Streptomyces sp. NPDC006624]|uniref:DUF4383 domain-containing protein n=1 Tax=Streptomyces sp. NPDC006624 TaxID=3154892 RepID=UPI0033B84C46